MNQHETKTGQLGMAVQEANEKLSAINSSKSDLTEQKENYAKARHDAMREIELLDSYGDNISSELQKKRIDLKDSIANFEMFEQGITKEVSLLDHELTLQNDRVGSARSEYQFHIKGGNGVPPALKAELATKSRTKLSHSQKMVYIQQLSPDPTEGLKLFNELTPMI